MNELIDKFLFELFDGLRDKTTVLFGEFIADAQALAAIFRAPARQTQPLPPNLSTRPT